MTQVGIILGDELLDIDSKTVILNNAGLSWIPQKESMELISKRPLKEILFMIIVSRDCYNFVDSEDEWINPVHRLLQLGKPLCPTKPPSPWNLIALAI